MPRHILKLTDDRTQKSYYMEWSTVVDAPITYGMTLEEFKEYYKDEYGRQGMEGLADRLHRVEQFGTSAIHDDLDSLMSFNRAGDGETCLNKEQIIEKYCINIPMQFEYCITNIDNVTKILVGDADFIHHVRQIAIENDDAELSIITVGEAEDYLTNYCPDLKLEKK